jgi:sugar phosphate isomerase/epimerase
MEKSKIVFSVFTKPWKMPIEALGPFVAGLGFEGIELPVRAGYPVEPGDVAQLPKAVNQLAGYGVKVFSIAGPTDEKTIAACAEAGVPIIRIMAGIGPQGYMASVARIRREFDQLLPLLQKYQVKLGVQNHSGAFVVTAMGLRHLLEGFDPRLIAGVWDAAHNALQGEEPELGLDIIWPHLCMVNLKNAIWVRKNAPEQGFPLSTGGVPLSTGDFPLSTGGVPLSTGDFAEWEPYWTGARLGLASWPRVIAELRRRSYQGVVCLTAEYSDQAAVNRSIVEDLTFARSLFAGYE